MIVTKQLRSQIRDHRKVTVVSDGVELPGSIPFLKEKLSAASDPQDIDDLLGELAGEYLRAGLEDEHLVVQRTRVAKHPEAAVLWLGLAHTLSMRSDGADEARICAAKGVAISLRDRALVRHALNCQADIARRINDPLLFAQTLNGLIADAQNEREEDVPPHAQLIDNLPEGFCPPELVEQYAQILRGDWGPSKS
jgi:hypothetical protein